MNELVYIARKDSEILQACLTQMGIPFVVKDGEYDAQRMRGATMLVPGKLPVTERELDAMPGLRVIAKYGVGLDRIDVAACTARGILVCNTPTINAVSVAEHAVMLAMAAAKRVVAYHQHLQSEPDKWRRNDIPRGEELQGKLVAVVGLGRIGRYAARLFRGLGMRVVGYDPYVSADALPEEIRLAHDLTRAVAEADFVSVHVAGCDATRGMIGEPVLRAMKPSAILINTTRGFVVDEAALVRALDERRIAGAALDVFAEEPLHAGHPLLGCDNVIVTPHIAANTAEAHIRAERETAENLRRAAAGGLPAHSANGPLER